MDNQRNVCDIHLGAFGELTWYVLQYSARLIWSCKPIGSTRWRESRLCTRLPLLRNLKHFFATVWMQICHFYKRVQISVRYWAVTFICEMQVCFSSLYSTWGTSKHQSNIFVFQQETQVAPRWSIIWDDLCAMNSLNYTQQISDTFSYLPLSPYLPS